MRELDGSSAGGQFLRTALALSVLEDEPVRIENVRGDRSNPGLRHQHLAVLETMAAICDADVEGAELGAETVAFDPTDSASGPSLDSDADSDDRGGDGRVPGGAYEVDVGTAGSVTLLFDAVLPLATRLEAPLSVTATGGTDVAWSPPMDYYRFVKLPLCRRFGLDGAVELERRGFYPAGGGRATLHLAPSDLESIRLEARERLDAVRIYSTEAAALADGDVARRQAAGALERLGLRETDGYDGPPNAGRADLEVLERVETTAASDCPGSAVVIRLEGPNALAGVSSLGEPGKPAERVGEEAADAATRFREGVAPVDPYAADQLLVWLALAGGSLRLPAVTDHVESSLELLRSFGYDVDLVDGPTAVADGERSVHR